MERLDKLLANTGRWSRREVKELVRRGRVLLDGVPAASPEQKIDPETADIRVDGETVSCRRFTYVLLHKPAGVLSAVEDSRQRTVLDLLPQELKRQGLAGMIREKTGLMVDANFSGTKLKWILEHVEGARTRAEKGELLFGTLETWPHWQPVSS